MLHNNQNGKARLKKNSHSRSTSDLQTLVRQPLPYIGSNSPELTSAQTNLDNLHITVRAVTPNSPATKISIRSGNGTIKMVTHSGVTISTPPGSHISRSRSGQPAVPPFDLNQHSVVREVFDIPADEEKNSISITTDAEVITSDQSGYYNSFNPQLINQPSFLPTSPPPAYGSNFQIESPEKTDDLSESLLSATERNAAHEVEPLSLNQEPNGEEPNDKKTKDTDSKKEDKESQDFFSKSIRVVKKGAEITVKSLVSLVAGGSSAINAGLSASGSQPQDINLGWWNSLSTAVQADSVWNFSASLSVNFIFAYNSIEDARQNLKDNLLKRNQTRLEILENFITVTLGSSAAIASAAISYNAFSWTVGAAAYSVTIASLLINFTTRYVGVRRLINRFHLHLDEDLKIKNQCVKDFERIDPTYYAQVNHVVLSAFEKNGKKLNKEFIGIFATEFLELLEVEPRILKHETDHEAFKRRAFFLFEVVFACSIGLAALPTFTQKGYDGINLLVSLIKTDGMDFLAWYLKALVGAMPGIATAMLYTISALDFPKLTITIMQGLYDGVKNSEGMHIHIKLVLPVMAFLYLTIANGFASSSMQNVAEGVFKKANRIFNFISTENILGKILIPLNRIGGGVTNAKASFSSAFGKPDEVEPKLGDVIKIFNTIHIDNRLGEKEQRALKNLAFFSRNQVTKPTPTEYLRLDTRDDDDRSDTILRAIKVSR